MTCLAVQHSYSLHPQVISSEMTDVTLPLYSRNQKRKYGELRVGVKIFTGKVASYGIIIYIIS